MWVGSESKLPHHIHIKMENESEPQMVMENFSWNVEIDDSLFSIIPPDGYKDVTPTTKDPKEIADSIALALKNYSEVGNGKYPQVTMVYGDVTRDKMYEFAGYTGRDTKEFNHEDNYVKILEAGIGFGWMNKIMRENEDARYNGLIVGPTNSDDVLFSWKRDDGRFQVIYGDLKIATVDSL